MHVGDGVGLLLGGPDGANDGLHTAVMIGALPYVETDLGIISAEPMPGAELDLALRAGLVILMAAGAGRGSVDAVAGLDPTGARAGDRSVLVSA